MRYAREGKDTPKGCVIDENGIERRNITIIPRVPASLTYLLEEKGEKNPPLHMGN